MLSFTPPPPKYNFVSQLRMEVCEVNVPEHPVAENIFFRFNNKNILAQIVS